MRTPRKISDLLFAIFMIVLGLTFFVGIPYSDPILGILALVVGILKFFSK